MKIDLKDPRLTAFALGELKGDDAVEIAQAMSDDPLIRDEVDSIRATAFILKDVFDRASLGGADMLEAEQRQKIREISKTKNDELEANRSKKSFWQSSTMTGLTAAAAVFVFLFVITKKGGVGNEMADAGWNWSRLKTEEIMMPSVLPHTFQVSNEGGSSLQAVSTAISADMASYKQELEARMMTLDIADLSLAGSSKRHEWQDVAVNAHIPLPLASGAVTWPLLNRYIEEKGELPPKGSLRIEEMVNHFTYKEPSMFSSDRFNFDMELCRTPWDAETFLLAVHLQAKPMVGEISALSELRLKLNPKLIKQARILGYDRISSKEGDVDKEKGLYTGGRVMKASSSHGNYVFYELRPSVDYLDRGSEEVFAQLNLGETQTYGGLKQVSLWEQVSQDYQFAATMALGVITLDRHEEADENQRQLLSSILADLKYNKGLPLYSQRREANRITPKSNFNTSFPS